MGPSSEPQPESEPPIDLEAERLRRAAEATWNEYLRRVEAGELKPGKVELGYLADLTERSIPITRGVCLVHGPQAVVLSSEEFSTLGHIDVVWVSGEEMRIDSDSADRSVPFVIFPDDLEE